MIKRTLVGCVCLVMASGVHGQPVGGTATDVLGVQAVSAADPPPRGIDDIAALLNRFSIPPNEVASLQNKVRVAAPAGATPGDLAQFHFDRALAAARLGLSGQYVSDLEEAYRHAKASNRNLLPITRERYIMTLGLHHYGDALSRLAEWEAVHGAAGRTVTTALRVGLLSTLGRFREAEEEQRKLDRLVADLEGRGGGDWRRLYREADLGLKARGQSDLLFAQGKLLQAERAAREALSLLMVSVRKSADWPDRQAANGMSNIRDTVHLRLARILAAQGRLVDAELAARQAVLGRLQDFAPESLAVVYYLTGLIEVLAEQGRFEDCSNMARAGLALMERTGIARSSGTVLTYRALAGLDLLSKRRWKEAAAHFDAMIGDIPPGEQIETFLAAATLDWVIALVQSGRPRDARRLLEAETRKAKYVGGSDEMYVAEANAVAAMIEMAEGNTGPAMELFRRAAPILTNSSLVHDEQAEGVSLRQSRRTILLESYLDLLFHMKPGNAVADGDAFVVAESVRGLPLQKAIAASATRAAAGDQALSELVRREQDARIAIASHYRLLSARLAGSAEQAQPGGSAEIAAEIERNRATLRQAEREIRTRFPAYAGLIAPKPISTEEARTALRPGEAMIAILVGETRSYAWAIPHTGPVAAASVDMGAADVERIVSRVRKALDVQSIDMDALPTFDLAAAHEIYRAFLAPIQQGWSQANHLIVVSHGPLARLPFSLLPSSTGVQAKAGSRTTKDAVGSTGRYGSVDWLIRKAAITQLPSASVLPLLREAAPGRDGRKPMLGIGNPDFSGAAPAAGKPQQTAAAGVTRGVMRARPNTRTMQQARLASLPELPETEDELREIARAVGADESGDLLLGRNASEASLRQTALSDRRILVFATHGLVPGDLDGLSQPALALSMPGPGESDDGLLTMGEVMGLKLDADWVVLSACNTAAGEGVGADALTGLGRAFLYAGARTVLATNWSVESNSIRYLSASLFEARSRDPKLTKAEALRAAMLSMIDGKRGTNNATRLATPSYDHPIFWAPYSLVGDGWSRGLPH